ncbi:hypothetical protein HanXRQr2_Chr16g0778441 [Helianthus annuus]|uniref:Uncharacterized protein n=1 Tax=Helianthus annuus TaxID=4232 RepID=A0A9K3DX06_HELAN|nr:hypothetical protein HanXRQr2_Chr16g0778441 [Helianthus annuus]
MHPWILLQDNYDGFIRLLDVEKESFDLLLYTSAYQVFSIDMQTA